MARDKMEGTRKRDPFNAEPWIVTEVLSKLGTMSEKAIVEWANKQEHR